MTAAGVPPLPVLPVDWETFVTSVRGPAHARSGQPNQDRALRLRGERTAAIVVCDGVGSEPYAHFGAHHACWAASTAIGEWAPRNTSPRLLLRLLHASWDVRVSERGKSESATTCLLAVWTERSGLTIAQLGDGVVLLRQRNEVTRLTPEKAGPPNVTTGLGIATSTADWTVTQIPEPAEDAAVLLMTDGISDDLITGSDPGFFEYVSGLVQRQSSHAARLEIRTMLRDWPRRGHSDDKSLGMLWHRAKRC